MSNNVIVRDGDSFNIDGVEFRLEGVDAMESNTGLDSITQKVRLRNALDNGQLEYIHTDDYGRRVVRLVDGRTGEDFANQEISKGNISARPSYNTGSWYDIGSDSRDAKRAEERSTAFNENLFEQTTSGTVDDSSRYDINNMVTPLESATKSAIKDELGGFTERTFDRGLAVTQMTTANTAKMLSEDVFGSEEYANFFEEKVQDYARDVMARPEKFNFEDVDTPIKLGGFIMERAIETLPGVGAILAGGGAGGAVAMAAGIGKKALPLLGAYTANFGQTTGETNLEFQGEGMDTAETRGTQYAAGGLKAGLDFFALMKTLDPNTIRTIVATQPEKLAESGITKLIAKDLAKKGLYEGSTEVLQTAIDKTALKLHNPDYDALSEENKKQYIESFAGGVAGSLGISIPTSLYGATRGAIDAGVNSAKERLAAKGNDESVTPGSTNSTTEQTSQSNLTPDIDSNFRPADGDENDPANYPPSRQEPKQEFIPADGDENDPNNYAPAITTPPSDAEQSIVSNITNRYEAENNTPTDNEDNFELTPPVAPDKKQQSVAAPKKRKVQQVDKRQGELDFNATQEAVNQDAPLSEDSTNAVITKFANSVQDRDIPGHAKIKLAIALADKLIRDAKVSNRKLTTADEEFATTVGQAIATKNEDKAVAILNKYAYDFLNADDNVPRRESTIVGVEEKSPMEAQDTTEMTDAEIDDTDYNSSVSAEERGVDYDGVVYLGTNTSKGSAYGRVSRADKTDLQDTELSVRETLVKKLEETKAAYPKTKVSIVRVKKGGTKDKVWAFKVEPETETAKQALKAKWASTIIRAKQDAAKYKSPDKVSGIRVTKDGKEHTLSMQTLLTNALNKAAVDDTKTDMQKYQIALGTVVTELVMRGYKFPTSDTKSVHNMVFSALEAEAAKTPGIEFTNRAANEAVIYRSRGNKLTLNDISPMKTSRGKNKIKGETSNSYKAGLNPSPKAARTRVARLQARVNELNAVIKSNAPAKEKEEARIERQKALSSIEFNTQFFKINDYGTKERKETKAGESEGSSAQADTEQIKALDEAAKSRVNEDQVSKKGDIVKPKSKNVMQEKLTYSTWYNNVNRSLANKKIAFVNKSDRPNEKVAIFNAEEINNRNLDKANSLFEDTSYALPENMQDKRLLNEWYRAAIRYMANELEENSGGELIPDPNYVRGESDKPGDVPLVRAPSNNPDWFKNDSFTYTNRNGNETSPTVRQFKDAIDAALEAKKLTEVQRKITEEALRYNDDLVAEQIGEQAFKDIDKLEPKRTEKPLEPPIADNIVPVSASRKNVKLLGSFAADKSFVTYAGKLISTLGINKKAIIYDEHTVEYAIKELGLAENSKLAKQMFTDVTPGKKEDHKKFYAGKDNFARIYYHGDKYAVVIHSSMPKNKAMFALAHEFGHAYLESTRDALSQNKVVSERLRKQWRHQLGKSALSPDKYSFNEWFADQVALSVIGMAVSKKGIIGRKFKELSTKLRDAMRYVVDNAVTQHMSEDGLITQAGIQAIDRFTVDSYFAKLMDNILSSKQQHFDMNKAFGEHLMFDSMDGESKRNVLNGSIAIPEFMSKQTFNERLRGYIAKVRRFFADQQYREQSVDKAIVFIDKVVAGGHTPLAKVWADGDSRMRVIGEPGSEANKAAQEIADILFTPVERKAKPGFSNSVFAEMGMWLHHYSQAFDTKPLSREEMREVTQFLLSEKETRDAPAKYRTTISAFRKVHSDFYNQVVSHIRDVDKFTPGGRKNHFPRLWDHTKVEANRQKLVDLINHYAQIHNVNDVNAEQSVDFIIALGNNPALEEIDAQPTSSNANARTLWFVPNEAVMDLVIDEPDAVLNNYVQQMLKKYEWQSRVSSTDEHGNFLPRGKIDALIDKLPTDKDKAYAENYIKAHLGQLRADMDPQLKGAMALMMALFNVAKLPLSTLSSLMETALIGVRLKDTKMKGVLGVLKDSNIKDALNRAKEWGFTEERMLQQVVNSVYGSPASGTFTGKTADKLNGTLFKYNGQQFLTSFNRAIASTLGEEFLVTHAKAAKAGDAKSRSYIEELIGTGKKADYAIDAIINWHNNNRPTPKSSDIFRTKSKTEKVSDSVLVQHMLSRFVDEAVLRPNAGHRPIWGSDPLWALVSHLKQYFWAAHKTIMPQLITALKTMSLKNPEAAMPLFYFGVLAMGLSAFGLEARDELKQVIAGKADMTENMGTAEYAAEIFFRANGAFALEPIRSAMGVASWSDVAPYGFVEGFVPTLAYAGDALSGDIGSIMPVYGVF